MQRAYRGDARGFTLVELIVTVAIVGILAAVAVPKYQDVKGKAMQAATDGVAGGAASAASLNLSYKLAGLTTVPVTGTGSCASALVGSMFSDGTLPNGYSTQAVGSDDCTGSATGGTVTCQVVNATDNTVTSNFKQFCTM